MEAARRRRSAATAGETPVGSSSTRGISTHNLLISRQQGVSPKNYSALFQVFHRCQFSHLFSPQSTNTVCSETSETIPGYYRYTGMIVLVPSLIRSKRELLPRPKRKHGRLEREGERS